MIKVIHFIEKWSTGGMEKVVSNILLSKHNSKCEFTLIICKLIDEFYLDELKKEGIRIIFLDDVMHKSCSKYFRLACLLKEMCNKEDYDIAHIHLNNCYGLRWARFFKVHNLKVIAHSHNTGFGGKSILKGLFKQFVQHLFVNEYCDYFVGCSQEAIDFAFGKKLKSKQKVIFNGVDLKKYMFDKLTRAELRERYNIDNDTIVLGHIGHFNYQKNHIFLIEIISMLAKISNRKYVLLLIGDGETKEIIKENVLSKNIEENVIFVPANMEVDKYYSMFDIFLFPSKFEGFGIVAIEAQVSGLYTIISDRVPDFICLTDKCNVLGLDVENWCQCIEKKELPYERKNYDSILSDNGFEINYTIREFYSIYEELFENDE